MRWLAFFSVFFALTIQAFFRFALFNFTREQLHVSVQQFVSQSTVYFVGLMLGYVLMTMITAFAGTRWGLFSSLLGSAAACAAILGVSNFPQFLAVEFAFAFFAAGVFPALIQGVRELFPSSIRPALIGLVLFAVPAGSTLSTLPGKIGSLSHTRLGLVWLAIPLFLAGILTVVSWPAPPPPTETSRGSSEGLTAGTVAVAALALADVFLVPLGNNQYIWLQQLRNHFALGSSAVQSANMVVTASGTLAFLLAGVLATGFISLGLKASKTRAILLTAFGCLVPLGALSGLLPQFSIVPFCLTVIGFHACTTLLYSGVADALPARAVSVGAAISAFFLSLCSWLYTSVASVALMKLSLSSDQGFANVFLPGLGAMAAIGVVCFCVLAWFVPAEPKSNEAAAPNHPASMAAFR